jgi:gliding motility-associated-like protein
MRTISIYSLFIFSFFVLSSSLLSAHDNDHRGFIENKNQFHENVRFQAFMNAYTVFLENNTFTFLLESAEDLQTRHDLIQVPMSEKMDFFVRGHAYKVNFLNSSPMVNPLGQLPKNHTLNYFLGNDEEKWATNVKAYQKVVYNDLYDGVDLLAVMADGNFKYDFIVQPNKSTTVIELGFEGLDNMQIVDGDLVMTTSLGEVKELKPFAYQMNLGTMQVVPCNFVLNGNIVSFEFPEGYDAERELIIDPVVVAATLSGTVGGGSNYGHGATYDLIGNIYTHAISFGTQYPVTPGAVQGAYGGGGTDIAISKLNPTGTDLLYATFLGGDGSDYPHSTITNDLQELFVYGTSNSANYPTTANAFDQTFNGDASDPWAAGNDIVVSKINVDGTVLMGSTYVGGELNDGRNVESSLNYGDSYRGEIVVDDTGLPYIVSQTLSTDFPVTGGAFQMTAQGMQDAVVFKMNANLSQMIWSTYLGTSDSDTGYGIRVANNGQVYVSGSTKGTNLPVTAGAYQTTLANAAGTQDGFVARLSSVGNGLISCTYIGTDMLDQAFFVDLDNDENVWIYGQSAGNWPVVGGGYSTPDGKLFVSKLNHDLTDLLLSSRIGPGGGFGNGAVPVAFLVDRCDRIYISGYSAAAGWELTADAVLNTGGFILSAWEEDMSLLAYSTYYSANHVDGGTSRFDKSGIVYQGVCSGGGFQTNPDAYATDQSTGWDIGVFKIDFELSGVNAAITANDDLVGCAPHDVQFNNYSIGDIFIWDFGDGSPVSNEFEPIHTYTEPGVYNISLISYDSLSCNLADTAYLQIEVGSALGFVPAFTQEADCVTLGVECTNDTGLDFLTYVWDMGDGTTYEEFEVNHTYASTGTYTITMTATDEACDIVETISEEITILDPIIAEIGNDNLENCGELTVQFDNLSTDGTYSWNFGDGNQSASAEPEHTFVGPGIFDVMLVASNPETCNLSDTAYVSVAIGAPQDIEALFMAYQSDCENNIVETVNQSTGDFLSYDWDMGDGFTYTDFEVSHQYVALGSYDITLTVTDTLCDVVEEMIIPVLVSNEVTSVLNVPNAVGCSPFDVEFENLGNGATYIWDFGDGTTSDEANPSHTYNQPGDYTVSLIAIGNQFCPGVDTSFANVTVIDSFVQAAFFAEQSGECQDHMVSVQNVSIGDDLQITWDFDGVEILNIDEYTHAFPGAGTYTITLTALEPQCLTSSTYSLDVEIVPGFMFDLGPDRDLCYYQNSTLLETGLAPNNYEFEWMPNAETESTLVVTQPGTYQVSVTDGTCFQTDEVVVSQGVQFQSSYNLEICEGLAHQINIPANGLSYQWATGQTTNAISIDKAGDYVYSFIDIGNCVQTDTVHVTAISVDSQVFIPNTFTPNGDGLNELFKVVGSEIEEFELIIVNRWGETIFQTSNIDEGWNGSLNNDANHYVPDGTYLYMVNIKGYCQSERQEFQGHLTVLR